MASVTETELEVHHEQSGYLRPTITGRRELDVD